MKYALTTTALLALLVTVSPAQAQEKSFSADQKKEIETLVHDYLMNNPQVIMDSVEKFRQRSEEESTRAFDDKVKTSGEQLYNDPTSPVAGNPKGDVVLVEFFDYNCGYCKMAFKDVQTLVNEDKNLKVVFKEIPILSEASHTAARYALAADKQGKYWEYHTQLMTNGANGEVLLEKAAKEVGLDFDQLKKDADSTEIRATLEKNLELAREIGITGTPGFVIGDKAMRGHYGIDALRKSVSDLREAQKKD